MEGPSLFLAAEQLTPFIGKVIKKVEGNTKIGKERLLGKKILSIFSHGKYLFFQFDSFALRIHFLLWGSFQATVDHQKVTGDYPTKTRIPRLAFELKNGHLEMYSCSVRFIESEKAKELCDFSIDIMSTEWNKDKAFTQTIRQQDSQIADVLLDQTIFMGVGNIIKNEALLLAKFHPERKVKDISLPKLKKLIKIVRSYVFQFYEWRKNFELKKHYRIYRQSICKECGTRVIRKKTGKRNRLSYICNVCQK